MIFLNVFFLISVDFLILLILNYNIETTLNKLKSLTQKHATR